MSVHVMAAVWKLELPDSEKIVLLALADCANDEGHCWPGMKSLVKKCSKTDRTIQTAIRALCDAGHLTRREVPGKGCNYTVHPRSDFAPEAASPPKGTTSTPEAVSGKPSKKHNTSRAKALSVTRAMTFEEAVGAGLFHCEAACQWSSEEMNWTRAQGMIEYQRFQDSNTAHGRRYKDWMAAWRNWCRSPFCKTEAKTKAIGAW